LRQYLYGRAVPQELPPLPSWDLGLKVDISTRAALNELVYGEHEERRFGPDRASEHRAEAS
jgi:hypothetical protein